MEHPADSPRPEDAQPAASRRPWSAPRLTSVPLAGSTLTSGTSGQENIGDANSRFS